MSCSTYTVALLAGAFLHRRWTNTDVIEIDPSTSLGMQTSLEGIQESLENPSFYERVSQLRVDSIENVRTLYQIAGNVKNDFDTVLGYIPDPIASGVRLAAAGAGALTFIGTAYLTYKAVKLTTKVAKFTAGVFQSAYGLFAGSEKQTSTQNFQLVHDSNGQPLGLNVMVGDGKPVFFLFSSPAVAASTTTLGVSKADPEA